MRLDLPKSSVRQRLVRFFRPSSGSPQIDRLVLYYLAGLAVIAVLIGVRLIVQNQTTAQAQMSALIINMSGRQGMLSQQIALFAALLVTDATASGKQTVRAELLDAGTQMEMSYNNLVNGNAALGLTSGLSPAGHALYFDSPLQIDMQVRAFLAEAKALAVAPDSDLNPANPHAQYILRQATTGLLPALDAAVTFHQSEMNARIDDLQSLVALTLILILLSILATTFIIFRPLVRRAQHEQATLRKERTLLRTLIDNIPDYIFAKDREGCFLVSNIAHARAVNAENPDDLVGRPASDFFPLELAAQFDDDDHTLIQSGTSLISLERVTVDAAGNRLNVSTTKVPLRTGSGEIIGLVGISRDITARKRAEEAEQRSQALYRMLAQNLPNSGVMLFDHDLRYLLVAGTIFPEMGYQSDAMEGKTLREVVQPESADKLIPYYQSALKGERIQFEWLARNRTYLAETLGVKSENGEIFAGMLLITNITERKQAETHQIDLRFERERVAILNRFIQDASHEFWTPLSIVQTSLYLLEKTIDPVRHHERIETIREQANTIERLVNDMLLMSRLDGDFEYAFDKVNVTILLDDIARRWQPTLSAKNLTFNHAFAADLPPIKVDSGMFPQAVDSLIRNAYTFTTPGGTVGLDSYRTNDKIAVRVSDTGVGMTGEIRSHIFERFYRGDPARSSRGPGLGLSIAQKIIEAHGGTIQVESAPGKGSTFTVYFPLPGEPS